MPSNRLYRQQIFPSKKIVVRNMVGESNPHYILLSDIFSKKKSVSILPKNYGRKYRPKQFSPSGQLKKLISFALLLCNMPHLDPGNYMPF